MKKVYFLSILTVLLVFVAAESIQAVSNAAVLYLRVAAGARPGGMGEAFVSIADDATATYWNPAGLGNSPIAGQMDTKKIPFKYGEISHVVTLKRSGSMESWFIADGQLIMFNGKSWSSGKDYLTSSDQTIYDFVNGIIAYESDEQVGNVAARIVQTNCPINPDDVTTFVETIKANIPEEYKDSDELVRGLDSLAASYKLCLVKPDQFKDLYNKFEDGYKDSVLIPAELDKITFSIESALMRFLPSKLVVPFSATLEGELTSIAATSDYLWVGTNAGLYRLSGQTWARFSEDDGIPSSDILSLGYFEEHLLIGTAAGLGKYFKGSFETISSVPAEPVSALSMRDAASSGAVVGGRVYNYDGLEWSSTFNYTVRLDDTIESIARRFAMYGTQSEHDFLVNEIMQLNQPSEVEETATVMNNDTLSAGVVVVETEGDTSKTVTVLDAETGNETVTEEPVEAETTTEGTDPNADNWFTEGAVLQVPYSAPLKYDATVIFIDLLSRIWVGTTSGLLSFDGIEWSRHGYNAYVVGEEPVTAHEIAGKYLPNSDETNVSILAENIDDYNDLNGESVAPGKTVYVYNWNTGAQIYSIGSLMGQIYVGTEYGLERLTGSGWESVDFQKLDIRKVIAVYQYDGASYYIASDGITSESKGMRELVLMHVNWLPSLNLDIYYDFASYVHNVRGLGTFGVSIIYLNYGTIARTDASGNPDGELNPFEIAIAASFGTSLSSRLKGGLTGRFIHSRLSPQGAGEEQGEGIASTISFDFGLLYKLSRRMQLGAAITNLGPDITYIDADQRDALPRNFGFGLSYKVWDSPYNSLIIQGELNKMLVNVNKGFKTELEYAIRHIGAEYWYSNFIALRAGYKYDKEGEVKHLTFGAGLKISPFRLDFAYVPSSIDSPLANTLRISFTGTF